MLVYAIVGFIAGLLAKAIDPGPNSPSLLMTLVLGIIGAVVGGLIGGLLFGIGVTGFNLQSLLVATLGSLLVLYVARKSGHRL